MTALENFKSSNSFDSRYQLPNSPQNSNPWFYTALAVKLITDYDFVYPFELDDAIDKFIKACETDIGLFNRWPNNRGGPISQDELIGIAYLDSKSAFRILSYLFTHDGIYINQACFDEKYKQYPLEILEQRQDMYRFYWFEPYLKACAKMKISLISQLKYSFYLITDLFTVKPDDASGRLLRFVMNERMNKYWLCQWFIALWKWRMNKLNITPKNMLILEPAENPVFAEHAPERW
jgi:hypothetical protein